MEQRYQPDDGDHAVRRTSDHLLARLVNFGTTGFGFTLPSLFTVGLLPPFQVGTAPSQQSPDGLIPTSVLNLGLGLPTQTTDVLTLLGLPNAGDLLEALLTPVYNTLVTPFGNIITNALNGFVGPLTNGVASAIEHVTALLAQLTGGLPGAIRWGHLRSRAPIVCRPKTPNS